MVGIKKETTLQGILRASILNIFAKTFGYLRLLSIAILVGLNLKTDAFFLALSLLGIFMIFVESLDTLGVPNLVQARKKSITLFYDLTANLFYFVLILAIILTALAFLLSPLIINIALGFNAKEKEFLHTFFLLLIPFLFFNFPYHFFGAINRSLRKFSIFFIGEFLFSFSAFLFTILGLIFIKDEIILPISLSLAQIIATTYLFMETSRFLKFKKKFKFNSQILTFTKQFLKLLIVYVVFHLSILVDRIFASFLPTKSISALTFGWTVAIAPKNIFRFENIVITSLSEVNAAWEKVAIYLKNIGLFSAALAILIYIFAPFIVKILFEHGAFSNLDTELVTTAIQYYVLGLPFIILWAILYRIFQIKDKILALVPIIVFSILINGIFNYIFIFKLNLDLKGICIATDISYFALVFVGFLILKRVK